MTLYRSYQAVVSGDGDKLTALIAGHQLKHGNTMFDHFGSDLVRGISTRFYYDSGVETQIEVLHLRTTQFYTDKEMGILWEELLFDARHQFSLSVETIGIDTFNQPTTASHNALVNQTWLRVVPATIASLLDFIPETIRDPKAL